MNIIIFGPPGSGKGTQADMLAKKYGLYHFAMGDELRSQIKKRSAIGKRVEAMVNSGNLVPDSITNDLLTTKAAELPSRYRGMILDGYPRKRGQLEFVKKNFGIDAAIELHVTSRDSLRRIASRRLCPVCNRGYNTLTLKPKRQGICDYDGTRLVQRDDDKPVEVKKRLRLYHEQTEPLKKYYKDKDIYFRIDGGKPISSVNRDLQSIIRSIAKDASRTKKLK